MTAMQAYFSKIPEIPFEGRTSKNPLAFRWYDKDILIQGKRMEDHFRFAMAYWHSMCGGGADPFGSPTRPLPWIKGENALDRAKNKMDAAFEFMSKMGLSYYCFHDVDLIEEGASISEYEKRMHLITDYAHQKQAETGIKLLWGTANLFSHPRYMNGAATNPDFRVLARASVQVKAALDATIKLGGENYVFWGGREGYLSLLNTDMKRELDNLARFLESARDYGRSSGFNGTFLIEPKPMEPTKHQYDYDAATVLNFLRTYDLMDDFSLNLEVNHATLAGHTMEHEMQVAANAGKLGSIDANRGDYQNGWDTDEFPNNINELVRMMLVFLEAGGLGSGGINFDAKLRRNSTDLEDLFIAHISGMDAFARALIIADTILRESAFTSFREARYKSYSEGDGFRFTQGELSLVDLCTIARQIGDIPPISGKQEKLEQLINMYI
jgi:xylose isomerase